MPARDRRTEEPTVSYDRRSAHRPSRKPGTHIQRALIAARNAGHTTARDYLTGLGLDAEFVDTYESAFGRATAKAFRATHGAEPDSNGAVLLRGRIWSTNRYADTTDLIAGALAYKRTAHLVTTTVAAPAAPKTTARKAASLPRTTRTPKGAPLTAPTTFTTPAGEKTRAEDIRVGDTVVTMTHGEWTPPADRNTVTKIERTPHPDGGEFITLTLAGGWGWLLRTGQKIRAVPYSADLVAP
jgi:hypothetical protein